MTVQLTGIGVSRGIAIGKAYLLQRGLPEVSEYAIPKAQIKDEVTRFMRAVDAARQQPWDPSVQALAAVPDAVAKLNQDIRWTTVMGDAFLARQAKVMNAVQQTRSRARGEQS